MRGMEYRTVGGSNKNNVILRNGHSLSACRRFPFGIVKLNINQW